VSHLGQVSGVGFTGVGVEQQRQLVAAAPECLSTRPATTSERILLSS
jgi:hypothetical protein